MMTRYASFLLALTCALTAAALPAGADAVLHARVSYEAGGAMVKGTSDSDWSYATINTLILSGDTLWADA